MSRTSRSSTDPGRGEATKLALILAAEKLFATSGVAAVSLRAICAEAGQKNIGSVQYHFGGKEELLGAILAYREQQFEPVRKAALKKAEAGGATGDIQKMLDVIFASYANLYLDHDNIGYIELISYYLTYIRPLGRIPHPADRSEMSSPSLRQSMVYLHRCLAPMDNARFARRMDSLGALFLSSLIRLANRQYGDRQEKLEFVEELMAMMHGALLADS